MFTGLVKGKGRVSSCFSAGEHMRLGVDITGLGFTPSLGDSVAVDGVCLTVSAFSGAQLIFDVMEETVASTTLSIRQIGDSVNIEASLTLSSPLGGHLLLGDVDFVGVIKAREVLPGSLGITIQMPEQYYGYIAEKGRIAVDGASLTVFKRSKTTFTLSLIPHTQDTLTLTLKAIGDKVNVEVDLFAKYIKSLLEGNALSWPGADHPLDGERAPSEITQEMLKKYGF